MMLILFLVAYATFFAISKANNAPIIGILTQESVKYDYYIAASYVKFIESAGGRVFPIWVGQNEEYYEKVVSYTNGLLFPGGAALFYADYGYADAAFILYSYAIKSNNNGIYYPIWGTCLGMELLAVAHEFDDIRVDCSSHYKSMPLNFKSDYNESRLYSGASKDVIEALKTQNVTYNSHGYCLLEDDLTRDGFWMVLTTNKDDYGIEFVSSFESIPYPFYGVQFHPEKNSFEFKTGINIPHTCNAVKVCQYYANFFVNECRYNNNQFPYKQLEEDSLIYNYNTTYSAIEGSYFTQIYKFTYDDFINNQLY